MADPFAQILQRSVRVLLRPVARICMNHALKMQDFLELAKAAFVDAAVEEIQAQSAAVSSSRVAILTGLQRRDVGRLLSSSAHSVTESAQPAGSNLLTRIIGQWQHNRSYRERGGAPRMLSFEGSDSEFADLVRSLSKDLSHYAVLFELERLGLVKRQKDKLKLQSQVYSPAQDAEQGLRLLEGDWRDLMCAVEENIFSRNDLPHLHLKTEYDNICLDDIPKVRRWILDKGTELHAEAREYLSQFDKDLNPRLYNKAGRGRIALGTFSFSEVPKASVDQLKVKKSKL